VRIDYSLCGVEMLDLHLCLCASVNIMYILHTPIGLYNTILAGYLFIHRYLCLLSPTPFLAYLIYCSTVWMIDFENFQTIVNEALVLKNRRGMLKHKHK
jgi:hypothetical protein